VTDAAAGAAPTWTVAELHDAISGLLSHVFGDEVWVEGEIRNLNRSAKGHVYFDLVDPDRDGDPQRPMLSVTLFDQHRQAVNRHLTTQGGAVRMGDGIRVRIRGRLNVYGPRSTLQVLMSWIDPAYTLGVMGQERDRVLALMAAEGLLGANRSAELPAVPLHVALLTSIGSAAHADALDELVRSDIGFRVVVVDARTQGGDAERSITAGLRVAAERGVDVVLLVRGGGARTDLAAFDTEGVARAIAACPVPVVTGIGHEIDRTVADEVAHSAHKTPTAAAAAIAERGRRAAHDLDVAAAQLPAATRGRLVRASQSLDRAAHRAGRSAAHHLNAAGREVDHLARRSAVAAPRRLQTADAALVALGSRVVPAARRTLADADRHLAAAAARARAHDPAAALGRGWSITRDEQGRAIRSVEQLHAGQVLVTTVADGTLRSTVLDPDAPSGARPQEPT
jgi:exodeoxyribonuclease VII large subunit